MVHGNTNFVVGGVEHLVTCSNSIMLVLSKTIVLEGVIVMIVNGS